KEAARETAQASGRRSRRDPAAPRRSRRCSRINCRAAIPRCHADKFWRDTLRRVLFSVAAVGACPERYRTGSWSDLSTSLVFFSACIVSIVVDSAQRIVDVYALY